MNEAQSGQICYGISFNHKFAEEPYMLLFALAAELSSWPRSLVHFTGMRAVESSSYEVVAF